MVDSNQTSLAVISLDSALKKDDSYYPQVFKTLVDNNFHLS